MHRRSTPTTGAPGGQNAYSVSGDCRNQCFGRRPSRDWSQVTEVSRSRHRSFRKRPGGASLFADEGNAEAAVRRLLAGKFHRARFVSIAIVQSLIPWFEASFLALAELRHDDPVPALGRNVEQLGRSFDRGGFHQVARRG